MADISVANTDTDLSGKTLLSAENPYTVTGLHTFSRGASAPFAVASGAASVTNLDADKVDGKHSSDLLPNVIAPTTTGTQNDWVPGTIVATTVIRCNNASALTITGIAGGVDGYLLRIVAVGTATVTLKHSDAGSAAANRFTNLAASAATVLQGGIGWADYVYSGSVWRMIECDSGWLTPTYAGGDYTASAGTWTVEAGDVQKDRYILRGKTLTHHLEVTTTSVSNAGVVLRRAIPGGFTNVDQKFFVAPARVSDAGAAFVYGHVVFNGAAQAYIECVRDAPGDGFGIATNTTAVQFEASYEVT